MGDLAKARLGDVATVIGVTESERKGAGPLIVRHGSQPAGQTARR